MTLHKDLRVMFGDTVAVVLEIAQDGKYAKIQYGDTKQHWVLSSLLQGFSLCPDCGQPMQRNSEEWRCPTCKTMLRNEKP